MPPVNGRFVVFVQGGFATAARKDMRGRLVACNEHGERVGEDHQHARLTNAQVDEIRDRYEASEAVGYKTLARDYGVAVRTIRDIVNFRRRNAHPERWKRIDN